MFVQMADAIRSCELEPYWIMDTEPRFFRAAIYAYLSAGIPLLMNGGIYNRSNLSKELGVHAVAITGYRNSSTNSLHGLHDFNLASSKITKLYCHDDAVGPYARMEFDLSQEEHALLSTSHAASNQNIGKSVFYPDALLIPLYHKIRVPFLRIYDEVHAFDKHLKALAEQHHETTNIESTFLHSIEWDIRLTTVNNYKTSLLNDSKPLQLRQVLEGGLPRYLWLARARHHDGSGLDLLFDATGLELSNLCLRIVDFGATIVPLLRQLAASLGSLHFPGCEGILQILLTQEPSADDAVA